MQTAVTGACVFRGECETKVVPRLKSRSQGATPGNGFVLRSGECVVSTTFVEPLPHVLYRTIGKRGSFHDQTSLRLASKAV